MRGTGLSALLLLLGLSPGAAAHRLDEYLQATLLGVTPWGVDVEIRLTPGVAMLPLWMAVLDQDRDGRISTHEQRAYVARVAREIELRVDGVPAPLTLLETRFPGLEDVREGLGAIVIKLHSPRTGRNVRFENHHLPGVSAYLVNCLASPTGNLVVSRQQRDQAQRSIQFDYSFGAEPVAPSQPAWIAIGPFWPAAFGLLLVRLAALVYRAKTHKRPFPAPPTPSPAAGRMV